MQADIKRLPWSERRDREYAEVVQALGSHNILFAALVQIGRPVWIEPHGDFTTAGVLFDRTEQKVVYLFCGDFWDSLNPAKRAFVVAHELLHIILRHIHRGRGLTQHDLKLANHAMDCVVNQMLVLNFGFPMPFDEKAGGCVTFNNTFTDDPQISRRESFEYYTLRYAGPLSKAVGVRSNFDDHSVAQDMSKGDLDHIGKTIQEAINSTASTLDPKQLKNLRGAIARVNYDITVGDMDDNNLRGNAPAPGDGDETQDPTNAPRPGGRQGGTEQGHTVYQITLPKPKPKRKWETIIRDWVQKKIKEHTTEHWLPLDRRTAKLRRQHGVLIPSSVEFTGMERGRLNVVFFLDSSGSCEHHALRFIRAARSLPKDSFVCELFGFDVRIYPIGKDNKLMGFGGTDFGILESGCQLVKNRTGRYPDGVFVLTDGEGTHVEPEKPERWYWFLTENGEENYIPEKSHLYQLTKFE